MTIYVYIYIYIYIHTHIDVRSLAADLLYIRIVFEYVLIGVPFKINGKPKPKTPRSACSASVSPK